MRAFLLAVCVLLTPAVALAQVDGEASYKEGVELRKQGNDLAALEKFEAAYGAGKAPKARAQMALAEQALGRWVAAERHLLEALSNADDPWIVKQRTTLDESLVEVRKHLGTIEVVGAPGGAEIMVSGNAAGLAPLAAPLRVEVGTYTVEAKKPGYYSVTRIVTVDSAVPSRCDLSMKELPAVKPPAPVPAPRPSATAKADRTLVAVTLNTQSTWFYVSVASAAGFAVLGTTALLLRNGAARAYNDDADCLGRGAPEETSGCRARVDRVSLWQSLSITSFIGSAALSGIAVIAYRRASSSTTSVSLACGASIASLACTGTF